MHYPLKGRGPIVVNRDDFAAPPTRGYEPPLVIIFFFFYRFGGGSMTFLRVPLLYNHWREIVRITFFLIFCFAGVWELGSELILSYFAPEVLFNKVILLSLFPRLNSIGTDGNTVKVYSYNRCVYRTGSCPNFLSSMVPVICSFFSGTMK